jgi:hypothetical protein
LKTLWISGLQKLTISKVLFSTSVLLLKMYSGDHYKDNKYHCKEGYSGKKKLINSVKGDRKEIIKTYISTFKTYLER